jgi:glycosyltransferase involved in cell wall biosynthesis
LTALQIMLPYWGDPQLLRVAIESVTAQEDPRWSAVVVDDASPWSREVRAMVEGIGDPRLRYLRNDENLGITRNFQRCLDLADQDLVMFMGCDDLLLPGYVGAVLDAEAQHPDAALFLPAVTVIGSSGAPVRPMGDRVKARMRSRWPTRVPLGGDALGADLLTGNWLYFPALTFRREHAATHGFDDRWRVVEDIDLIMRIIMGGGTLVLLDETQFAYRRHASSVSSLEAVAGSRFAEEGALFAEIAKRAELAGWRRTMTAARRHWTSRLHAAALLPTAVARSRDPRHRRAAAQLTRHAIGR